MRLLHQTLVVGCCLLTAPASPLAQEHSDIPGVYVVEGTNANGEHYDGTVEIVAQGDTFIVHWALSNTEEAYGVGIMSHGQLVVAAGLMTPAGVMLSNVAAYTLRPGGPLVGEWAMPGIPGIYKETLTKLPGHPRAAPRPLEQPAPAPHRKPGRAI